MAGCCCKPMETEAMEASQRKTLKIVLVINALMFLVILSAALYADSTALFSDSFDNLGDAITYGLSIYAVGLSLAVKSRVALLKGALIALAALLVTIQIGYRIINPSTPIFEAMGLFSLLGLIANGTCAWLLWRHRNEDINMKSVWECSRNDAAGNISVFVAAAGVWLTQSGWPDLVVAALLAALLYRSAWSVISDAWTQNQAAKQS